MLFFCLFEKGQRLGSPAAMCGFICFLLCFVLSCLECAAVRKYTKQEITTAITDVAHWGFYDDTVRSTGVKSTASSQDDNQVFDPLNFCIPFFQQDAAQLFISSNGFISLMPVAMCTHFCSSLVQGFYPFDGTSGGNWPAIALYLDDLDPTSGAADAGIFKANKTRSGGMKSMIVEYYKIPPFTVGSNSYGTVTAQVEFLANGTIFFRYKTVLQIARASTGLVWSTSQRVQANRSELSSGQLSVYAIRFDPYLDPCGTLSSCTLCAKNQHCSWCNSLSQCVDASVVNDYCSNADLRTNDSDCSYYPASEQAFYNVKVKSGQNWDDLRLHSPRLLNPAVHADGNVSLPFHFPLFYNPPVPNPSDPRITSNVFVSQHGVLSPNPKCWAVTTAWHVDIGCDSDLDQMIIAPFAGDTFLRNYTSIFVKEFPTRTYPSSFCNDALEATCPAAVIFQFESLGTARNFGQRFTYQVLLDANGNVQFFYRQSLNQTDPFATGSFGACPVNSVFRLYPSAVIGIYRSSIHDTGSAAVPWSALNSGVSIRFKPFDGCLDCGSYGSCNFQTRQCQCQANFVGNQCSQCIAGHYGVQCAACPTCLNGGQCDEGRNGTGHCSCVSPYSGANCSVRCPGVSVCTPECNGAGGICECGVCKCNADLGFYGPTCSNWTDPCRRLSLDGCGACVTESSIRCVYCSDYRCMIDPSQTHINTGKSSACLVNEFPTYAAANCPSHRRPLSTDADGVAIIVVLVALVIMAMCCCLTVLLYFVCKKPRQDPLIVGASVGIPDFQRPRREREVMQIQIVPPRGQHRVLGIPLKQIPLHELYLMQRSRPEQNSRINK